MTQDTLEEVFRLMGSDRTPKRSAMSAVGHQSLDERLGQDPLRFEVIV